MSIVVIIQYGVNNRYKQVQTTGALRYKVMVKSY